MTTLAIIGGGIAGSSLLHSLAKEHFSFDEVLFFHSENFAFPCSLHSTAVVAPRGVSAGVSQLGDILKSSFEVFQKHVHDEAPSGVYPIRQFTGTQKKLDAFKLRYPHGKETSDLEVLKLKQKIYFASEDAYLVDPPVYLNWLVKGASERIPIKSIPEFVTSVVFEDKVLIQTQNENSFKADYVIFAGGAGNRFWKTFHPSSKLQSIKTVQGAYLRFKVSTWDLPSFSLTLEGQNLIYHSLTKQLLIGSTSQELSHELSDSPSKIKTYQIRIAPLS